ncbi:MAG TPA: SMI1/KNR4 family protein [Blastocatellia bacterium]
MIEIEKLISTWKEQGLRLPIGVDTDQIVAFERLHAVKLPLDLKTYFLNVNGMDPYPPHSQDREGFSFWSLQRLRIADVSCRGHAGLTEEKHYVFADYLNWSWAYSIRLSEDAAQENTILLLGGDQPMVIARSFSEFIDSYMAGASILYGD